MTEKSLRSEPGGVLFPKVTEEEIRPPGADPFIEQEDMKNDESATQSTDQ